MFPPLGAHFWAAHFTPQALRDSVVWSWHHHDTLRYLLVGVVMLSLCFLARRHDWPLVAVVSGLVGAFCLITAAGTALLGDFTRKDYGMSEVLEHEIRRSHKGPVMSAGGACRVIGDCEPGTACVKVAGSYRCWKPCGADDSCPAGQTCAKTDRKQSVCTW